MTLRLLILRVVHALYLYLLILTNFWTFLSIKWAGNLHVGTVLRVLVRVPDFIVAEILRSLLSLVSGDVYAVMTTYGGISVRILESMSSSTSILTRIYHSGCVLISYCSLCSQHLLIFHEFLMTRITTNVLQTIWVSATMALNLFGVMFGRYGNHSTILIMRIISLTVLSSTSDKDYVSLRNTSIVGGWMRSLLVRAAETCSRSVVLVHTNREPT